MSTSAKGEKLQYHIANFVQQEERKTYGCALRSAWISEFRGACPVGHFKVSQKLHQNRHFNLGVRRTGAQRNTMNANL